MKFIKTISFLTALSLALTVNSAYAQDSSGSDTSSAVELSSTVVSKPDASSESSFSEKSENSSESVKETESETENKNEAEPVKGDETENENDFSVVIPLSFDAAFNQYGKMDSDKKDDFSIVNNSDTDVKVTKIYVRTLDEWKLANYSDDFGKKKVGTKVFALKINNCPVKKDGTVKIKEKDWIIPHKQEDEDKNKLELKIKAKVAAQKKKIEDTSIATIEFSFDSVN